MSSPRLPKIPSLRRQQLHLEFASLRVCPPAGVYVSMLPNDPSLWTGVLFVQKGPYASAILRFRIRFPPSFPDLPPLITLTSDIFHPLLSPLTTYTSTTNASHTDPISASDEERLPAGGFSLRHGFPHWFGRERRSTRGSAATQSRSASWSHSYLEPGAVRSSEPIPISAPPPPIEPDEGAGTDMPIETPVLSILNYMRTTFDNEDVLDSIPLEAAGNPSAWHAWRAHRRSMQGLENESSLLKGMGLQPRPPGEWNWEGVWDKRVKNNIETSYLESVLFGSSSRDLDDPIRFTKYDHDMLDGIKAEILSKQFVPPINKSL